MFVEPVWYFAVLFGEASGAKLTHFSLKEPSRRIQYKYTSKSGIHINKHNCKNNKLKLKIFHFALVS